MRQPGQSGAPRIAASSPSKSCPHGSQSRRWAALFLQSTGFVLNPSGQVVVGVYSTGAIGRLMPDDVIDLIRYLRAHAA